MRNDELWYILLGVGGLLLLTRKTKGRALESVTEHRENIIGASSAWDVPASLIAAMIHQESGGDPQAFGFSNEYGLMQILCSTAKDIGFQGDCNQLFSPSVNLYYGTKYLRWQYDRYGNWRKAISAYNAGHYTETNRGYTDSVMSLWSVYESVY